MRPMAEEALRGRDRTSLSLIVLLDRVERLIDRPVG
jgi:hypothetical protein